MRLRAAGLASPFACLSDNRHEPRFLGSTDPDLHTNISATHCPFWTGEVESAFNVGSLPDTWPPTSTLTSALRVPLAVT